MAFEVVGMLAYGSQTQSDVFSITASKGSLPGVLPCVPWEKVAFIQGEERIFFFILFYFFTNKVLDICYK